MIKGVVARALTELDRGAFNEASMLTAVSRLSTPETLSSIIQTLLARPQQLASELPTAIAHANGFIKLVLATDGHSQIRLHLWPNSKPARPQIVENAHNHRWSFATKILHGSYTETTYAIKSGNDYARYSYSHEKDVIDYQLSPVEVCGLDTMGIATYTRDSTHWINPEVVHRVSPTDPRQFTATFLIVAPAKRQSTDVFVSQGSGNAVGYTRHRPLTNEEIADHLVILADTLGLSLSSERAI